MTRFVMNNHSVFSHVSVPNCSLLLSPSPETALGLHFISMLLILSSSRKMEVVLWPHSRRHKENREFSQEIPMTLLNRREGTCGSQRSLWEEIKASPYADGTTFPSHVLRPSTRCRKTRCRGLLPSSNL